MKYIAWFLANTLWFGFFMYMIIFKDWSAWYLIIPLFCHWNISDIK